MNQDQIEVLLPDDDLKQKVEALEKRVAELEKKEKRRKIAKIIKTCVIIVIYALLLFAIYQGYKYIVSNYIKPLGEVIETTNEISNTIDLSQFQDILNLLK